MTLHSLTLTVGRSEHGPIVQSATSSTQWNTVAPAWREQYHLCVYDSAQVLKLVMAHNMETGGCRSHNTSPDLHSATVPLQSVSPCLLSLVHSYCMCFVHRLAAKRPDIGTSGRSAERACGARGARQAAPPVWLGACCIPGPQVRLTICFALQTSTLCYVVTMPKYVQHVG